jgi:acyl transferase domain-containing protein/SAM-dependent methyltransferase/NAD(P)-dependent dehydrogenase (short-subunit alcohol dehydrogenase family)/acyl carrier protein
MTDAAQDLSPVKQALLMLQRQQERIRELEQAARQPIAIVGLGLRCPGGVATLDGLWELLAQGRDAITEVPPDRWDLGRWYDPDPDAPGRMHTRHGGFCADVDRFDAPFFRLSALEARAMDPQQRLLLEVAWEALEDANVVPGQLEGTPTGVYVGASTTDYFSRQQAQQPPDAIGAYYVSGGALSVTAGRLSYLLGLQGPSLSVDTACSSSLTALHLACQALRQRQCGVALAAGVGLLLTPEPSVAFAKARMLAPDGRCKTFDAAADGYVRGEGCVVLVLKRADEAIAAGDRILALVHGTAVNQNGASGGLTVPSGPAQEAVIRAALADAGATPEQVGYVEAHGTGTSLGDPIELRALGNVFAGAPRPGPLWVGSVKTNIGHLEAAAGLAGVAKVVASLQHGAVAPHLHLRQPTPHFAWDDFPLRVPTALAPWPDGALLAGVSSFGFAGSNAHAILAPAPVAAAPATSGATPALLTLSAQTPNALAQLARRYAGALLAQPAPDLAAFCQTANRCRTRFAHRLAAIASTPAAMAALLQQADAGASGRLLHGTDAPAGLQSAGRAWLAGERVDWDAVDPVPRPRLALPTYPFQRERHWYDQAAAANASDLLGHAQPTAFLAAQYETALQDGQPAFLGEHRVAGRIVVAAAHWTAMMLRALERLDADAALDDVQFLRAAVLADGERRTVQLGIAEAPDAVLRIASRADTDSAWTRHVQAKVVTGSSASGELALDAVHARCARPVDVAALYAHAQDTGIDLGPHFRPLRSLRAGDGEALAELAGPLTPGVIDGCFQAALAALPQWPAATLVPAGIARVQCGAPATATRLWCHARITQQRADGSLVADLLLADDSGRACLVLSGFEAKPTHAAAFAGTAPWADWLYRVEWERVTPAGALPTIAPADVEGWIDRPAVDAYARGLAALDAAACAWAREALQALGGAAVVSRHARLHARLKQLAATAPSASAADIAGAVRRQHPAVARELAVVERCGQALPDVLRGSADPLELLFPGGDTGELAALYADSAAAHCMNTLLARSVAAVLQALPGAGPLRVLEIGAGTGGSTGPLLAQLRAAGRPVDYTFTDVSPRFLPAARERFGVACAVLDIERDPQAQGLAAGGFDLVVAANVVHATAVLQATLRHARGLLAPGGVLALLEGVAPRPWLDLVFGLTPGWWRFDDPALRPDHALLGIPAWRDLLARSGFGDVQAVTPDAANVPHGLQQAVLLARRSDPQDARPQAGTSWLVLGDGGGTGGALAHLLRSAGAEVTEARDAPPTGATPRWSHVVDLRALDDMPDGDAPPTAPHALLELTQQLLATGGARLTLAFAGLEAAPPGVLQARHAAGWGFAKALALEHPELHCRRVDLGALRGEAAAQALLPSLLDATADPEASLRAGRWHVPRLARHAMPARVTPAQPPTGATLVTGAFGGLGLLLAETLVQDGARDLLLLGRRAPDAAARARLDALQAAGARVRLAIGDVCDAAFVQAALRELDADGVPLHGVFHAAGVLDDALVRDLDTARLQAALAPKLQGAWNLHRATAGRPVQRFVLYSSAASLLGSAGQASHAAGNAYLDQLALQRQAQGLPALSIGWSAWSGAGAAARLADERAAGWRRQGFATLDPREATQALRALLAAGEAGHVGVVAIDWARLLQHRGADPLLARFARQAAPPAADPARRAATTASASEQRPLADRLQGCTDTAQRTALLQDHLCAELARILGWANRRAIDPQQAFLSLGLDSLTSMELRNRLQSALGRTLQPTLTFDHPTVAALARHLAEDADPPASGSPVDAVADEDLDALLTSLLKDTAA